MKDNSLNKGANKGILYNFSQLHQSPSLVTNDFSAKNLQQTQATSHQKISQVSIRTGKTDAAKKRHETNFADHTHSVQQIVHDESQATDLSLP